MQSPADFAGWRLSYASGRSSPQAPAVPTIMPRKATPCSWQDPQAGTADATVACPEAASVGALTLAVPMWKPLPPGVTFVVEWQPEPLQSRLPIGMWLPGVVTGTTLANVVFTVEPWQVRQPVTPW